MHVSKVRSLAIDHFETYESELIKQLGNEYCNSILNNKKIALDSYGIDVDSPSKIARSDREKLIKAKYVSLDFHQIMNITDSGVGISANDAFTDNNISLLLNKLLSAIEQKNLRHVMSVWMDALGYSLQVERFNSNTSALSAIDQSERKCSSSTKTATNSIRSRLASLGLIKAVRCGYLVGVVYFTLNGADLNFEDESDGDKRTGQLLALSLGHKDIYFYLDKQNVTSKASYSPVFMNTNKDSNITKAFSFSSNTNANGGNEKSVVGEKLRMASKPNSEFVQNVLHIFGSGDSSNAGRSFTSLHL